MTQPTVTLPREEAEYLAKYFEVNGESTDATDTVKILRAALDSPQPVDCRGCASYYHCNHIPYLSNPCVNGDKYEPAAPLQLYKKVTK